jgi:hypothetical protein
MREGKPGISKKKLRSVTDLFPDSRVVRDWSREVKPFD